VGLAGRALQQLDHALARASASARAYHHGREIAYRALVILVWETR